MSDPGEALFGSLRQWRDLEELITAGEVEGLHLECKSPGAPTLSQGLRSQLAEAVSGFSNTLGGVIIWGMATTPHSHAQLDTLTQIEPIGHVKGFAAQIDRAIPLIAFPTVQPPPTRIIKRKSADTKGVAITHVPHHEGDPVQSLIDRNFYWRTTDGFAELPYDMLKRMFAGTSGPLLSPRLDARLIKKDAGGAWRIPFAVGNESSATALDAMISVRILNPDACSTITPEGFRDAGYVNPAETIYMTDVEAKVHRGLDVVVGNLYVTMQKGKRPRRVLKLLVTLYASGMRARKWTHDNSSDRHGFSAAKSTAEYVY